MITYLIGLVDEVRPVKNTNRQTGEITQTLEVTVTYSSHDLEGYKVKDTEIFTFAYYRSRKMAIL